MESCWPSYPTSTRNTKWTSSINHGYFYIMKRGINFQYCTVTVPSLVLMELCWWNIYFILGAGKAIRPLERKGVQRMKIRDRIWHTLVSPRSTPFFLFQPLPLPIHPKLPLPTHNLPSHQLMLRKTLGAATKCDVPLLPLLYIRGIHSPYTALQPMQPQLHARYGAGRLVSLF